MRVAFLTAALLAAPTAQAWDSEHCALLDTQDCRWTLLALLPGETQTRLDGSGRWIDLSLGWAEDTHCPGATVGEGFHLGPGAQGSFDFWPDDHPDFLSCLVDSFDQALESRVSTDREAEVETWPEHAWFGTPLHRARIGVIRLVVEEVTIRGPRSGTVDVSARWTWEVWGRR